MNAQRDCKVFAALTGVRDLFLTLLQPLPVGNQVRAIHLARSI